MSNIKLSKRDIISDILMVLLYMSFTLFSNEVLGIYGMIVLLIVIFFVYISSGKKFNLHWSTFHWYILTFAIFSFISLLWSRNPQYAIEKGITLLSILACFTILYAVYYNASISRLLTIIMWGGFFIAIYSIFYYGLSFLGQTLEEESRLENKFANVNTIGTLCSLTVILSYYFFKERRKYSYLLLILPTILIVAGSGSRKAFVMVILGVLAITLFIGNSTKKYNTNKTKTIILTSIIIVLISFIILQTGIMNGTLLRMDGLISSFTGEGEIDSSTLIRMKLRALGFTQLQHTPFLGIGMGNARNLALSETGMDVYLHCNYAELAANGGIIGLFLYYWIYFKIIYVEWKHVKYNNYSILIFIIILLQLIMDWGSVSYYSKSTYFILMVAMLHIRRFKTNKRLYYA